MSIEPRRVVVAARRVTLFLAVLGAAYLFWRADVLELPEEGCSPLHGFAPGARVLVDRAPGELRVGHAVLFRGRTGELLLGRIATPGPNVGSDERAQLAAGDLWILTERDDCPGRDSDDLGPIPTDDVVARLLLSLSW